MKIPSGPGTTHIDKPLLTSSLTKKRKEISNYLKTLNGSYIKTVPRRLIRNYGL